MNAHRTAYALLGSVIDSATLLSPARGCAHPESPDSFCTQCGHPMWTDEDDAIPLILNIGDVGLMRLGDSSTCLVGVALSTLSDFDGAWSRPLTDAGLARSAVQLRAFGTQHGLDLSACELHLALFA